MIVASIRWCLPAALFLLVGCSETETGSIEASESESAPYSFDTKDDQVKVLVRGKPLTSFHFNTKWDKPFIYPLRSPSGIVISRGYPVEPREGEEQDHAWHRGIWYGYGDLNGEDFWREKGRDVTSRIVLRGAPSTTVTDSSALLKTTLDLVTPKDEVMGTLQEDYEFRETPDQVIIDARIAIIADKGQALTFGDTDDGGFAVRLSDQFRQDQGAVLINSNGERDTENIWGKRAKWVDYSANVEGKQIGVSMFDHPSNFRHPTPWHARGYSVCAANPFGMRSYLGGDTPDGRHTIPEGESLSFRYRVIIHEGATTPEQIEEWYADFAAGSFGS